jgi:hypothetical protein
MTYRDGEVYFGTWKDGQPDGFGEVKGGSDGLAYKGGFREGLYEGQGSLTSGDGFAYEGRWKSGLMNGKGVARYAGGDSYVGGFLNGLRDGRGVLTRADGTLESGIWRADVLRAPDQVFP